MAINRPAECEKTKPIKPNLFVLSAAFSVLRQDFVIPVETGIQSLGSYRFRIKCGMTGLTV